MTEFMEGKRSMAKYYVQCGMRNLIVDAVDASAAAMHLIDAALQPHVWIYDDADLSESDRHNHLMFEALLHLAPEIRVSEQGHGRGEALVVGTPETVQLWHRTMVGLTKLFVAAGLVPRPMRQIVAAPVAPEKRTRAENSLGLTPIRKAK